VPAAGSGEGIRNISKRAIFNLISLLRRRR